MTPETTRAAAVAGQFYARDPEELRNTVKAHIEEAHVSPAPRQVDALIVPHAGYIYSGPTAGHAFARVNGKEVDRVVLVGCSHRFHIDKASVWTRGAFATPLGEFPADAAFSAELARKTGSADAEPHVLEHALEVQLPFMRAALGVVPIVPVLLGGPITRWHEEFGEMLAHMLGPNDLVIASTDLSHYLSQDEATAIDRRTIAAILAGDVAAFGECIRDRRCSACGAAAVAVAMAYATARKADHWELLDYRTSAHASGDCSRVVGYAAISMERAT